MFCFPRICKVGSPLLLGAVIGCLSSASLVAQAVTGFTLQKLSGVALVKPQAWSKDNEATVVEFSALMDRTAKGSPGAGYFELHSKAGDKRQISAAKVIRIVLYPDPAKVPDITGPDERAALQKTLTDYEDVVKKYPAARSYLGPTIKTLTDDLAKFDSGEVRLDGKWVANTKYQSEKAASLVALLKADVVRASPPSSFSVKEDFRFVTLRELAATDPAIRKMLAEVVELHAKLLRGEERDAVMARLAAPNLSTADAADLVVKLKTLQPEENAKSDAYLKAWNTGTVLVEKVRPIGAELATELETEMAGVSEIKNAPPELSPALTGKIADLNKDVRALISANPAPQLLAEAAQSRAVCLVANDFQKLAIFFKERQFLGAKDLLDGLSPQIVVVGPETIRVVQDLHRFSLAQIEAFTRLRQEAKLLTDNGKQADALAKFEAAYEVMPDPAVGDQIKQLKKQLE